MALERFCTVSVSTHFNTRSLCTLAKGDVHKPRFHINVRCTVRGRGAYLFAAETFALWFQQSRSHSQLQFGVHFHVIGNTDTECWSSETIKQL